MRSALTLLLCALVFAACQCVPLPTELRCTADSCAAGQTCGEDGRCSLPDAGCTPTTSCAIGSRECGLLDTGCGEVSCGDCGLGLTCGSVQSGRCAPCNPTLFDAPDPDFADSNCDGIDGTVDGGLFVDPQAGSDLSPGTRERPLYTLSRAQALALANPAIHTVFVAQGDLEGVRWSVPVSIAGGYRTPDWLRARSAITTIRSRGTGLRLESVPATASLSQLKIESTAGVPGTPTVGLMLVDSPVKLQQLVVRAGDGADGLPGPDGVQGSPGGPGGNGERGTSGQLCMGCTLPVPGHGGDAGVGLCGDGAPGNEPPLPTRATRLNLSATLIRFTTNECNSCPCQTKDGSGSEIVPARDADPREGADAGLPGDAGQGGPPGPGSFDAGVWVPLSGSPGSHGSPGDPGLPGIAGGSAIYAIELDAGLFDFRSAALGSSGGGGGAPGCGGRAGGGGLQGGPSVGLLVVGFAPRFEGVSIASGRGGAGGRGGQGGPGGAGGLGGAGGTRWTAECELPPLIPVFALNPPGASPTAINSFFTAGAGGSGGPGGTGGLGGLGGPGPGGPSVGVWCERTTVAVSQLEVHVGEGGDGGVPGVAFTALNCQ